MIKLVRPISRIASGLLFAGVSACSVGAQHATVPLPAGTALRVALDRPVRIHKGAALTGHLTKPVYLIDHQVVPSGSLVTGLIVGTHSGSRSLRIRRLLAADFTPPRVPDVTFRSITVAAQGATPAQTITVEAPALQTDAAVLTLGKKKQKRSIKGQISDSVEQAKSGVSDVIKHRRYKEIVEKWAVGQLPYHPEILWSNTRFNADLASPTEVVDTPHPELPRQDLHGLLPEGTLHVRLLSPLSSGVAKRGDSVEAVTTQPLLSPDGKQVMAPEGTPLHGTVVQVKRARRLGRNGSLRFTFNRIDLTPQNATAAPPLTIHGRLSAAETAPGANVSIDEEGETKANDTPAKYAEPIVLGVLAAAAGSDEHHQSGGEEWQTAATSSNGMGLIARVVSLATRDRNVVQGFAYYALAKSVYYRLLARGHETVFDHDTELEVTLSER
ncbi:hypothetical protein [Terriglobus sp.]|uniref:hypothetical protein n=1 Tax=Terriglobus sp. TaxID=1889013 RepID=UPI003AFFBA60